VRPAVLVAIASPSPALQQRYARGDRLSLRPTAPVPDVMVLAIGGDRVSAPRNMILINDTV
jgi:hypothetical protein